MIASVERLRAITREVWGTVAGIALEDAGQDAVGQGSFEAGASLTGTVHLSGAWRGAVHLLCSELLAGRAARAMFGADAEVLDRDDLHDAVGELTNVIAGNLKGLLSGESFISLPSVIDGSDYEVTLLESELVVEAGFRAGDGALLVTLLAERARGE